LRLATIIGDYLAGLRPAFLTAIGISASIERHHAVFVSLCENSSSSRLCAFA
jgi:hypothetical protein